MSSLITKGNASGTGSVTLESPNTNSDFTISLPASAGTAMVSGNMPAFSVYKSSAQTLSGATWTKLTFDTEEFDTNNNFASSRFTPTVAGYYQINGQSSNGLNTQTVAAVYKNGSVYKAGVNFSNGYGSVVSTIVYLNGSTDYVELYGYFAGGGNTGSGIESTWFNGCMVRAA